MTIDSGFLNKGEEVHQNTVSVLYGMAPCLSYQQDHH